jgi:hypothetical protein
MTGAQIVYNSMLELLTSMISFIPKLLVALIIWYLGKSLIGWGVALLKRVKVEGAKPVNKLVESTTYILMPLGKVVLFLIVLDYLGIGSSVIQALVSGVTFAIAIAVGLAFGEALKPYAKDLVEDAKKQLEK